MDQKTGLLSSEEADKKANQKRNFGYGIAIVLCFAVALAVIIICYGQHSSGRIIGLIIMSGVIMVTRFVRNVYGYNLNTVYEKSDQFRQISVSHSLCAVVFSVWSWILVSKIRANNDSDHEVLTFCVFYTVCEFVSVTVPYLISLLIMIKGITATTTETPNQAQENV